MADVQEDDLPQLASLDSADFFRVVENLATVPVSSVVSRAIVKAYFDTLYEPIGGGGDGWTAASETWTRTGNHTFTISTDVTAKYKKGTKIKYKDGGAFEYGVIHTSAYSSPNTTVTLITNADYTMAAATITDKYISYQNTAQGFPDGFTFTTTQTGNSVNPTTLCRWSVHGHVLRFAVFQGLDGTSNATTLTFSSPVTALNITNYNQYVAVPYVIDNGAQAAAGVAQIGPNSTTINLTKSTGAAWTASAAKAVRFTMDIEF